jgi:ribonuclease R
MTKIFYDRSGKAHKIGSGAPTKNEKKDSDKKESRGSFKAAAPATGGAPGYDRDRKKTRGGRSEGRGGRSDSGRGGHGSEKWSRSEHRTQRGHGKSHSKSHSGHARAASKDSSQWISLKGRIDKNKKGSAFLIFDRSDLEDLFVPYTYTEKLFHGDRVEVFVSQNGEIEDLKVLEHRFKLIFGKISIDTRAEKKSKIRAGYLIYERKRAKEEIYVPSLPANVKEGDWVKAELTFGENGMGIVSAEIKEVIGPTLPATYDIQMVVGEFNLKEHHSAEAVRQAESFKLEIPGKDEKNRTDLRHLPLMTIDGERARDFDDAVYVENLGSGGFRLWVAIADVCHYVKEGTVLDDEAYERATSVYFPERAFHMLPRALSENLCSLIPNVPRMSMACSMDYSSDGTKSNIKIYDAIIQSCRRATYNEIEAEKDDPKHADMFALYRMLKAQRHERGSIDFEFPEAEIILDEQTGEPSDIVVRERGDAHRLIEEFMIRANESVAEWMLERKRNFIFRIHEEPSPEAMEKFKKLARTMGVHFADKGGTPRPKDLAIFLKTLKNNPAEPIIATALLRSMRQAIYSGNHGEHYGLASEGYTHFTSPIRRYPDLIAHRLLRMTLHGEEIPEDEQEKLDRQAEHCSYRERVATEAEREAIRFKQVRLMAKHLGEEFDGKVNGMNEKGIFVQLWHPYCEGMLPVDKIGDDIYQFNEERMVMAGRKTKRTFQIGDPVRVLVARVDMDARQVEFELIK